MNSQDFFYIALGGGFLILVTAVTYLIYRVTLVVKEVRVIVKDIGSFTHDVTELKDKVKSGGLGAITNIISFVLNKKRR